MNTTEIDSTFRVFKDEGKFPGFGTHHMYHRIDGKLIAVTVIDILPTVLVSCYCIYDPAYKFISPGVVTAIRELEYIRHLKANHLPNIKYY